MEQEEKKIIKKKRDWLRIILNLSVFLSILLVVWLISKYFFHYEFIFQKDKPLNSTGWTRQMVNVIILLIMFVVLYFTRIYEMINNFIGGVFSDKEEKKKYKNTKIIVWIIIAVLLYFFLVPKAIDLTNSVSSLAVNLGKLFIHLIPILLIAIALHFATLFGIKHWKKQKANEATALDLEKDQSQDDIKGLDEIKEIETVLPDTTILGPESDNTTEQQNVEIEEESKLEKNTSEILENTVVDNKDTDSLGGTQKTSENLSKKDETEIM